MNVTTLLQRLLRGPLKARTGARGGQTRDERAARKYWDAQIAADRERRGVTDKHP